MKDRRVVAILIIILLGLSAYLGRFVSPSATLTHHRLQVTMDDDRSFYIERGERVYFESMSVPSMVYLSDDYLGHWQMVRDSGMSFPRVVSTYASDGQLDYYKIDLKRHFGVWSFLPAIIAILFCWILREPMSSLFLGIVSAALLLGKYDVMNMVLIERLGTESVAAILILYLWLLGGLLGIWSKTGASHAFAQWMSANFVRGPRSAKLVAWGMGVLFFQGGTISTVLVGTAVKPIADENQVSHEELSYIVDSTASPIASQLAFNAWPAYVQSFIYVSGVSWLATETDRIAFFFKSVPFCFYAIFAVLGTFLLSIDKAPFLGERLKAAIDRVRQTGELDRPGASPLAASELQMTRVPDGYESHMSEFIFPLLLLIGTCVVTFIWMGTPQVHWAFSFAILLSLVMALLKGMSLQSIMAGVGTGLKGVVGGSVILLLAVTIGGLTQETGAAVFLVDLLGSWLPFWCLPVLLQLLTVMISFSTGTSWGTYAVAFPLAMPLSWAIAQGHGLENPMFFMTICFAAVMDGSVYGDQCSPISDTTVLSAMCTGTDLMDHVKTQIPQATIAAVLAGICWTLLVMIVA
ncbi:MAG: sodium:proton antiporter [Actinobacteria bacterium]|nr:sodium:proton antiporter [Actinomycetota bacterium]